MNPANTPLLETERLVLRRFAEDDLEALFNIYSDEEVNTYLPWFPLTSQEEARACSGRGTRKRTGSLTGTATPFA